MEGFLCLLFLAVKLPDFFHELLGKHLKHGQLQTRAPQPVNFLRMNQLGRGEQRGVKTILIIKSFPALTHPNDGQCVLDKEVEYQGDDADEGQDGHPYILACLCRIQLILSDISKSEINY